MERPGAGAADRHPGLSLPVSWPPEQRRGSPRHVPPRPCADRSPRSSRTPAGPEARTPVRECRTHAARRSQARVIGRRAPPGRPSCTWRTRKVASWLPANAVLCLMGTVSRGIQHNTGVRHTLVLGTHPAADVKRSNLDFACRGPRSLGKQTDRRMNRSTLEKSLRENHHPRHYCHNPERPS